MTEPRWYCLSREGMATLCTDKADAEMTAINADELYPRAGPHRAVQLVEAAPQPQQAAPVAVPAGWRVERQKGALRNGIAIHGPSGEKWEVCEDHAWTSLSGHLYRFFDALLAAADASTPPKAEATGQTLVEPQHSATPIVESAKADCEQLRQELADAKAALSALCQSAHKANLERAMFPKQTSGTSEPVAWITPGQDLHLHNQEGFRFNDWTPLYTHPSPQAQAAPAPPQGAQAPQQALTQAQRIRLWNNCPEYHGDVVGRDAFERLVKLVESVHRIGKPAPQPVALTNADVVEAWRTTEAARSDYGWTSCEWFQAGVRFAQRFYGITQPSQQEQANV